MSKLIVVEVCANGTLTRANARALNRVLGTDFSGLTEANVALAYLRTEGHAYRVVEAASLAGVDKARHTREVTRSRKAQAAREERKAAEVEVAPAPVVRPLPHTRPMPFARVA